MGFFTEEEVTIVFKLGRTYRHQSCLDIDLKILSVLDYDLSNKTQRCLVLYKNRNWQDGQYKVDTEEVTLKLKDFNLWSEVV